MTARSNSSFLAARAAGRRERRALARDIAEYRTSAERAELFAILDRNRSEDGEQIRQLLHCALTASAHR